MKLSMNWSAGAIAAALLFIGSSSVFAQEPEVEPVVDVEEPVVEPVAEPALAPSETIASETDLEDELDAVLGEQAGAGKAWSISGTIRTSIGQGTFVSPSNDTAYGDEIESGAGAFNRVNLVMGLAPSYTVGDFTFGG